MALRALKIGRKKSEGHLSSTHSGTTAADSPKGQHAKSSGGSGKGLPDFSLTKNKSKSKSKLTPTSHYETTSSKGKMPVSSNAGESGSLHGSTSSSDLRKRFRMPSNLSLNSKRSFGFGRSASSADPSSSVARSSADKTVKSAISNPTPGTPPGVPSSSSVATSLSRQNSSVPGSPLSNESASIKDFIPQTPKGKSKAFETAPATQPVERSRFFAPEHLLRKKSSSATLRSTATSGNPGEIVTFASHRPPQRAISTPASPSQAPNNLSMLPGTSLSGLAPSISGAGLNLSLASYISPSVKSSHHYSPSPSMSAGLGTPQSLPPVDRSNVGVPASSNALSYLMSHSDSSRGEVSDLSSTTVIQRPSEDASMPRSGTQQSLSDTASMYDDFQSVEGTYVSHPTSMMFDALEHLETPADSAATKGENAIGTTEPQNVSGVPERVPLGHLNSTGRSPEIQADEINKTPVIVQAAQESRDPFKPSDSTSFKLKKYTGQNTMGKATLSSKNREGLNAHSYVDEETNVEFKDATNMSEPEFTQTISPRISESSAYTDAPFQDSVSQATQSLSASDQPGDGVVSKAETTTSKSDAQYRPEAESMFGFDDETRSIDDYTPCGSQRESSEYSLKTSTPTGTHGKVLSLSRYYPSNVSPSKGSKRAKQAPSPTANPSELLEEIMSDRTLNAGSSVASSNRPPVHLVDALPHLSTPSALFKPTEPLALKKSNQSIASDSVSTKTDSPAQEPRKSVRTGKPVVLVDPVVPIDRDTGTPATEKSLLANMPVLPKIPRSMSQDQINLPEILPVPVEPSSASSFGSAKQFSSCQSVPLAPVVRDVSLVEKPITPLPVSAPPTPMKEQPLPNIPANHYGSFPLAPVARERIVNEFSDGADGITAATPHAYDLGVKSAAPAPVGLPRSVSLPSFYHADASLPVPQPLEKNRPDAVESNGLNPLESVAEDRDELSEIPPEKPLKILGPLKGADWRVPLAKGSVQPPHALSESPKKDASLPAPISLTTPVSNHAPSSESVSHEEHPQESQMPLESKESEKMDADVSRDRCDPPLDPEDFVDEAQVDTMEPIPEASTETHGSTESEEAGPTRPVAEGSKSEGTLPYDKTSPKHAKNEAYTVPVGRSQVSTDSTGPSDSVESSATGSRVTEPSEITKPTVPIGNGLAETNREDYPVEPSLPADSHPNVPVKPAAVIQSKAEEHSMPEGQQATGPLSHAASVDSKVTHEPVYGKNSTLAEFLSEGSADPAQTPGEGSSHLTGPVKSLDLAPRNAVSENDTASIAADDAETLQPSLDGSTELMRPTSQFAPSLDALTTREDIPTHPAASVEPEPDMQPLDKKSHLSAGHIAPARDASELGGMVPSESGSCVLRPHSFPGQPEQGRVPVAGSLSEILQPPAAALVEPPNSGEPPTPESTDTDTNQPMSPAEPTAVMETPSSSGQLVSKDTSDGPLGDIDSSAPIPATDSQDIQALPPTPKLPKAEDLSKGVASKSEDELCAPDFEAVDGHKPLPSVPLDGNDLPRSASTGNDQFALDVLKPDEPESASKADESMSGDPGAFSSSVGSSRPLSPDMNSKRSTLVSPAEFDGDASAEPPSLESQEQKEVPSAIESLSAVAGAAADAATGAAGAAADAAGAAAGIAAGSMLAGFSAMRKPAFMNSLDEKEDTEATDELYETDTDMESTYSATQSTEPDHSHQSRPTKQPPETSASSFVGERDPAMEEFGLTPSHMMKESEEFDDDKQLSSEQEAQKTSEEPKHRNTFLQAASGLFSASGFAFARSSWGGDWSSRGSPKDESSRSDEPTITTIPQPEQTTSLESRLEPKPAAESDLLLKSDQQLASDKEEFPMEAQQDAVPKLDEQESDQSIKERTDENVPEPSSESALHEPNVELEPESPLASQPPLAGAEHDGESKPQPVPTLFKSPEVPLERGAGFGPDEAELPSQHEAEQLPEITTTPEPRVKHESQPSILDSQVGDDAGLQSDSAGISESADQPKLQPSVAKTPGEESVPHVSDAASVHEPGSSPVISGGHVEDERESKPVSIPPDQISKSEQLQVPDDGIAHDSDVEHERKSETVSMEPPVKPNVTSAVHAEPEPELPQLPPKPEAVLMPDSNSSVHVATTPNFVPERGDSSADAKSDRMSGNKHVLSSHETASTPAMSQELESVPAPEASDTEKLALSSKESESVESARMTPMSSEPTIVSERETRAPLVSQPEVITVPYPKDMSSQKFERHTPLEASTSHADADHHAPVKPIMAQTAASPELPHKPMFMGLYPQGTLPWAVGTVPLPHHAEAQSPHTQSRLSSSMTDVDDALPPKPPVLEESPSSITNLRPEHTVQGMQQPVSSDPPAHPHDKGQDVRSTPKDLPTDPALPWHMPAQAKMSSEPSHIAPLESSLALNHALGNQVSPVPVQESSLPTEHVPRQVATDDAQQREMGPALSTRMDTYEPSSSPLASAPKPVAASIPDNVVPPNVLEKQPSEAMPAVQGRSNLHDLADQEPSRRYSVESQYESEAHDGGFEPRFLDTVPEERAEMSTEEDMPRGGPHAEAPAISTRATPAKSGKQPTISTARTPLQGTGKYDPYQLKGFIRAMSADNYEHAMRRAFRMGVPLAEIPASSPESSTEPAQSGKRPSELFAGKGVRWDSPDWLRSQLRKNIEAPSQAEFHAFLKSRRQIIPAFVWRDAAQELKLPKEKYVPLTPSPSAKTAARDSMSDRTSHTSQPSIFEDASTFEPLIPDVPPDLVSSEDTSAPEVPESHQAPTEQEAPVTTKQTLEEAADIVPKKKPSATDLGVGSLMSMNSLLSDSDPIDTSLLSMDQLEKSYQGRVRSQAPKTPVVVPSIASNNPGLSQTSASTELGPSSSSSSSALPGLPGLAPVVSPTSATIAPVLTSPGGPSPATTSPGYVPVPASTSVSALSSVYAPKHAQALSPMGSYAPAPSASLDAANHSATQDPAAKPVPAPTSVPLSESRALEFLPYAGAMASVGTPQLQESEPDIPPMVPPKSEKPWKKHTRPSKLPSSSESSQQDSYMQATSHQPTRDDVHSHVADRPYTSNEQTSMMHPEHQESGLSPSYKSQAVPHHWLPSPQQPVRQPYSRPQYEQPEYGQPQVEPAQYEQLSYGRSQIDQAQYEQMQYSQPADLETSYEQPQVEQTQHEKTQSRHPAGLETPYEQPHVEQIQYEQPQYGLSQIEQAQYGQPQFGQLEGMETPHEQLQYRQPEAAQAQYEQPQYEQAQYHGPEYEQSQFKRPENVQVPYEQPQLEQPQDRHHQMAQVQYDAPGYERSQYSRPRVEQAQYEQPQFPQPLIEQRQFDQLQYNRPAYGDRPQAPPSQPDFVYEPAPQQRNGMSSDVPYAYPSQYPSAPKDQGMRTPQRAGPSLMHSPRMAPMPDEQMYAMGRQNMVQPMYPEDRFAAYGRSDLTLKMDYPPSQPEFGGFPTQQSPLSPQLLPGHVYPHDAYAQSAARGHAPVAHAHPTGYSSPYAKHAYPDFRGAQPPRRAEVPGPFAPQPQVYDSYGEPTPKAMRSGYDQSFMPPSDPRMYQSPVRSPPNMMQPHPFMQTATPPRIQTRPISPPRQPSYGPMYTTEPNQPQGMHESPYGMPYDPQEPVYAPEHSRYAYPQGMHSHYEQPSADYSAYSALQHPHPHPHPHFAMPNQSMSSSWEPPQSSAASISSLQRMPGNGLIGTPRGKSGLPHPHQYESGLAYPSSSTSALYSPRPLDPDLPPEIPSFISATPQKLGTSRPLDQSTPQSPSSLPGDVFGGRRRKHKNRGASSSRSGWAALFQNDPLSAVQ